MKENDIKSRRIIIVMMKGVSHKVKVSETLINNKCEER